jgi:aminoglycoside phosphotransferase (APT) family kinase protein
MQSRTKVPISLEQIQNLVKKDISSTCQVKLFKELTDGWFNVAYLVETTNPDQKLVLKAAPPPDVSVLRYEKYGLEIEVKLLIRLNYERIIPVPKLIASELDVEKSPIGRKYFWMEFFDGIPLNKALKTVGNSVYENLYRTLATHQKQLNQIRGEWFGMYFDSEDNTKYSTWFEAVQGFFGWLIADYPKYQPDYPQIIHQIPKLLDECKWAFEEIQEPRLIHWDLWEGNVFVGKKNEQFEIIGITDFERALWGDPLMEVLFFQSSRRNLFISSYDPEILKSKAAKIRRYFYNIYLAMIIYIECKVRLYPPFKQIALRTYAKIVFKTSFNGILKLQKE